MATVEVVTTANKKAGTIELDGAVFEAKVRPHLFHAEVRRQLALRQAGTHSSKNRARVSGGGVKPYKQKGTGRARQGTIRAPQWSGGGVVFGPVPRSHAHALPKKVRRAALRGALSYKLREGALTVLESLELEEHKTRRIAEMLEGLGIDERGALIVIDQANPIVERSARNIPRVSVVRVAGLNVYDVLRHGRLVLTRAAADAIALRLGERGKGASA